jgi:hypothetical protein
VCLRKYTKAFETRIGERAAFRDAFAQRYGRRAIVHYPTSLSRLPEFVDWLKEEVGRVMDSDDKPIEDVFQGSRLLERVAIGYRAMYAHGMHLRIREAEEDKVTHDSGIAAAVSEHIRSRDMDSEDEVDTFEHVGWVEEILELNYRNHYYIVLVCSWILGAQNIRHPKLERDSYGFVLGNSGTTMAVGPKSFAFPIQCQQVFFSNDEKWNEERGGDWKVISGTNVRGRHGNLDMYQLDIEMLALGRDVDFEGLRGL